MVNFSREALFFAQLDVFRYSVEHRRREFVAKITENDHATALRRLYGLFIKTKSIRYKEILNLMKRKMKADAPSDRTLATYLGDAVKAEVLAKQDMGRKSYCSLALSLQEEDFMREQIKSHIDKIQFIPDHFRKSLYAPHEAISKTPPDRT